MTDVQQRTAAKQFVKNWIGHGDEKQETQRFWIDLLQNVFGVEQSTNAIEFEVRVKLDHTSFIDGYIKDTRVLIEQKGADIDLTKGYRQSDGSMLTPFQQARRYAGYLPHNMNPRWIVVCNFKEFHIHDMNCPNDTPEIIKLENLEKEYTRLQFLVDKGNERIQKEMEISLQAGELVGKLYDALLKQYNTPASDAELKSLNMLCVRLVFCLYAEDAGIFGSHTMFHDYLKSFQAKNVRKALIDLFKVLDTKVADRDPYMDEDLAAFPYVNGGLFADEEIIIPRFTEEIIDLLLTNASEDFNWSSISPTIFGAVFESTLNPETRRSGGMHYTSIENIHKVIDPLFYDALASELDEISAIPVKKTRDLKLADYQKKLASLSFLDPACGSGNFLTETYLSLRRLENKALILRLGDQIIMGDTADFNPIQVSIGQFYGIEINDFAVTVAKTALWIAESQMMKETEAIVHMHLEFLPLTSYANIVEGNALQIDWEAVVPKNKLNYIMGNPPFVGYGLQSKEQKEDMLTIYVDENGRPYKTAGKIDYVAGWYFKAAQLMRNTNIRTAFVSTNSITQGEQVAGVWKPLYDRFGIHIDFAHRTFRWDSEANIKAHVHCVIVGFSFEGNTTPKCIYTGDRPQVAQNINAYLIDAPNVFIESKNTPICSVPEMTTGNRPADGGHLILSQEEYVEFISKEPTAQKYIKKLIGAVEYINNIPRYCLWLKGANPAEIRKMPEVMARVEACRADRLNGAPDRQKLADTPTLFREQKNPSTFNVSPTTLSRYQGMINRYIKPLLGHLQVQELRTLAVQTWVNNLKISPSSGKPMSAATIKHSYHVLKGAMDKAVLAGIIPRSPCTGIMLPKGQKKEAVVYDEAQIKQLLAAAKGTDMELVIDMELCLGLRRGELLGLEWGDLDWDKNQVKIIRNRVIVNGKSVVKEPKTASSVRTLDVPAPLMQKLRKRKLECAANRMKLGRNYIVSDYVIVHEDGKPIYPEYLSQMLTKLQDRCGLPRCRFHDLRHLCASIMLLQGVNVKVAQERLGHKDITTTMNIYSHVLPSSAREAADKIGQLIYFSDAV